jgi:outer membrane protein assembly factor BamA
MLGLGTSSTDKVILSGSIAQNNFMGSGNNVAIQVNSAKTYRTYVFSYTNPYFTQDGVSQGFDVYHRTFNTTSTTLAYYSSSSTGGRFALVSRSARRSRSVSAWVSIRPASRPTNRRRSTTGITSAASVKRIFPYR